YLLYYRSFSSKKIEYHKVGIFIKFGLGLGLVYVYGVFSCTEPYSCSLLRRVRMLMPSISAVLVRLFSLAWILSIIHFFSNSSNVMPTRPAEGGMRPRSPLGGGTPSKYRCSGAIRGEASMTTALSNIFANSRALPGHA